MPATPFSYRQYPGNGATVDFSVPFPYLSKAHVHLYLGYDILDGTFTSELADGVGFTWSSGTQVQCTTAPAAGQTLTVIRLTPGDSRLVDWQDGSNLIADDLDTADLQNLYAVQEQQDRNDAAVAVALAGQSAATAATAAATAATTTANNANTTAAAAATAANSATTAANASTAASTAATTAAALASADAATAISTANAANATASNAVTTANGAVATAAAASATANQAAAAVSSAVLFVLVADVAAIPGTPANDDFIEVGDSTGIESFSPLTGLPAGFAGDAGLTVRLRYTTAGSTWNYLSYFVNDPETRYEPIGSGVAPTREIATGTGLTGGGDLSADRTITPDLASQAEAEAGASSAKLMTPLRTAQAIAALSPGGLYNHRPALHRGSLFYKTAAATISIVAGAVLNGHLYSVATAVTMPSHSSNTDYAIWQNPTTGALVSDASFTAAPAGAAGGSVVGGYHYIPSGRPTTVNNGSPTGASEILEFSLWDLTWRPACPDPRGMACIEGGFWMDLYLCGATSYAGATFSAIPSSRFGLTIADNGSPALVPAQYGGNGSTTYADGKWFSFAEVAASFGKRLPRWQEFSAAAFGAPEGASRGSDPGTVQWEQVSKFGLAQATGVLWQWGQETCTAGHPSGWTTEGTETNGRGMVFGPEVRAIMLGGNWGSFSFSGSRCARWDNAPWATASHIGARFASEHQTFG